MDSAKITIKLLGPPEIRQGNRRISLPFRKAEALVYYLAVNGTVTKEQLCNILWGEQYSEKKAKSSLRNALCVVRNRLGHTFILEENRTFLTLNPQCLNPTDWDAYLKSGELAEHSEFLQGFLLKDNDSFTEWVSDMEREFKDQQCQRAKQSIQQAYKNGEIERCIQLCKTMIRMDEYNEFGYRYLMRAYAQNQDFGTAIDTYQQLYKHLNEDLAVCPEEETTLVLQEIRNQRQAALASLLKEPKPLSPPPPPLGREQECSQLFASLQEFFRGIPTPHSILCGEAGIGKTFLLDHILSCADIPSGQLVSARCYYGDHDFPMKLWYDILTQITVFEQHASWSQTLQTIIPLLSPTSLPSKLPHAGNDTTHIMQALLNTAQKHRIVIAVDDLQWADAASISLLYNIATLDKGRNILFFLTCRTPSPELEGLIRTLRLAGLLQELVLAPFTYQQTEKLAESFLPQQAVSHSLTEKLFQESDGNPLFLTECLNSIRFGSSMYELTPKLVDIIQQRIESIPADCAKALEVLSVAPEGMEFDMLKQLLKWDDYTLAEILEQLLAQKFICEEPSGGALIFHFCHQKVLEYVYHHISNTRRRVLHGAVAAYLEKQRACGITDLHILSRVIFHFERSGQILKFLEYTIHNITGYLRLSLEFFPVAREEAPPLIFQGKREFAILSQADLQSYLDGVEQKMIRNPQIFSAPEALPVTSKFYYLRALHYTYRVAYTPAFQYADRILQLNTPADSCEKKSILLDTNFLLTSLYMDCYDTAGLERTIQSVWPLLSKQNQPDVWATWMRIKGMYCVMTGNADEAIQILKEAADTFSSMPDNLYAYSLGACWAWIGEALCLKGAFRQAETAYQASLSYCQGSRSNGGNAIFYLFYARFLMDWHPEGRNSSIRYMLEKARELYAQSDFCWYRGITLAYSALLACSEGNYRQGLTFLEEAWHFTQRLQSPYELCVVSRISMQIRMQFSCNQALEDTFSPFLTKDAEFYRKSALSAMSGLAFSTESRYLCGTGS